MKAGCIATLILLLPVNIGAFSVSPSILRSRRTSSRCVIKSDSRQVAESLRAARQTLIRPWQTRGVYDDGRDNPALATIAQRAGIPFAPWKAPRWLWKLAWLVGHRALPLLHHFDRCRPTDTNVNLWVCWLKAIVGNSPFGFNDRRLAYDLLPPITRRVVSRPLAWLYPLLHHQNIALRTAYLDARVEDALSAESNDDDEAAPSPPPPIVVVLGSGFDLRPLRLSSSAAASAKWVEVDLPHVSEQKSRLVSRLLRRRPELVSRAEGLTQLAANLTLAHEARGALRTALRGDTAEEGVGSAGADTAAAPNVVFVFEALLIYLPPEAANELLRACAEEAAAAGARSATVCFADRLPGVAGGSADSARSALSEVGLDLDEGSWLPKPGLARHMGVARARL